MPSPFPGMDPYLEGEMWQEFHQTLASTIRAQLMPYLKPKYVALLAKRFVVDQPALDILDVPGERSIYPYVHVVKPRISELAALYAVEGTTIPTEVIPTLTDEEVPVLSVEIRDVAERRLVTAIEILSPANKRGKGFEDYVERRQNIFKTPTHLLEIDFLRGGRRIPFARKLTPAPYYVFLSRAQNRPNTAVWAIPLQNKLPTVPVPLLSPDPDVPLDLQAAVNACFELVGYENLLDYTIPPPPPELSAEEILWVNAQLHQNPQPST